MAEIPANLTVQKSMDSCDCMTARLLGLDSQQGYEYSQTCREDQQPSIFAINPYPTAFPYGNGMVLHFYQQQESSTTKTVHKVINKGLKAYV